MAAATAEGDRFQISKEYLLIVLIAMIRSAQIVELGVFHIVPALINTTAHSIEKKKTWAFFPKLFYKKIFKAAFFF